MENHTGRTWLKTWRDVSMDRIRKSRMGHWGWAWLPPNNQTLYRTYQILVAIKFTLHERVERILQTSRSQVRLLEWHQVEESYREPAIHRCYRAQNSTAWQCIASIFTLTNETTNFWTHFLPSFYFLWRGVQLSEQLNFTEDWYTWPFLCYMISACLYPFVSSMAHVFSAMSNRTRHICFLFDYTAISLYSFGTGLLYGAYLLPESFLSSSLSSVFLWGCLVNSVVCTTLACLSRFPENPRLQKTLRLGSFTIPYLWDTAPLVYRLLSCSGKLNQGPSDFVFCQTSAGYHRAQLLAAVAACFFYGSHYPERILPGRFDLLGNSHNLLHIFGVTATAMQLEGALIDMQTRKATLVQNSWALGPSWSCGMGAAAFTLNILIVAVFCKFIHKASETSKARTIKQR